MGRILPVQVRAPTATELPLVVIWSGSIASIPVGFVLCDGSGGTPDLLDFFIRGVASVDGSGLTAISGSATASATHDHEFPPFGGPYHLDDESTHTHVETGYISGTGTSTLGGVGIANGGVGHIHPITLSSTLTVAHQNNINGTTDPATTTFAIAPPYYALAYISGKAEIPLGSICLYALAPSTLMRYLAGPVTSIASAVAPGDIIIHVADDVGLTPPFRAYVDSEVLIVQNVGVDHKSWNCITRLIENVDGTVAAAHAVGARVAFPKYSICDGFSRGAPNLFAQFVVGAGDLYALGASVGSDGGTLTSDHAHGADTLTQSSGAHTYAWIGTSDPTTTGDTLLSGFLASNAVGNPHNHNTPGIDYGSPDGAHVHPVSSAADTPGPTWLSGSSFSTIPSNVALYYVMRTQY